MQPHSVGNSSRDSQMGFSTFQITGYTNSTAANRGQIDSPPRPKPRLPAREKRDLRKTWTDAEDTLLCSLVQARTGTGAGAYDWAGWAAGFEDRNAKGLKARWVNSLRLKNGLDTHLPPWSPEEDAHLQELVPRGTRAVVNWNAIASQFGCRSATAVSGRWDVIGHVERRKAKRPDHLAKGEWSAAEDAELLELGNSRSMGTGWFDISTNFPGRSKGATKQRFSMLQRALRTPTVPSKLPLRETQVAAAPASCPIASEPPSAPLTSSLHMAHAPASVDQNVAPQPFFGATRTWEPLHFESRPSHAASAPSREVSYLADPRYPLHQRAAPALPSLASALSFASNSSHAFHPLPSSTNRAPRPLAFFSDPRPTAFHSHQPLTLPTSYAPQPGQGHRFPSVFAPSAFENSPLPPMFKPEGYKGTATRAPGPRPPLSPVKRAINRAA